MRDSVFFKHKIVNDITDCAGLLNFIIFSVLLVILLV